MRTNSGNVLFLILIAVALFAALSYAITNSSRSGDGVDEEEAEILASEVLQYITEIENGVRRVMLLNRVKDYQVNFMANPYDGATATIFGGNDNTNCTENKCRVFHPDGGGVYQKQWARYKDTEDGGAQYAKIFYAAVDNVGSNATDVVLVVHNIKVEVCKAINKKLLGTNSIIAARVDDTDVVYQNAVPSGEIPGTIDDRPLATPLPDAYKGERTFCGCNVPGSCESGGYDPSLHHVLIAR